MQAQPTASPGAPNGVVYGQVINGTAGATLPAGVPLTLYALTSSLETVIFTRTAQADANGQARFEGLDPTQDAFYVVAADYQRVPYFGGPQHFPPGQATTTISLTVYESSADPAIIRIEQLHVILSAGPASLQVDEVLVASNASDRTYIDEDGAGLRVTLPPAAARLQFPQDEASGRYLRTADGFADTQAVYPGEQTLQVAFSFALPYHGDSLDVALPTVYPVQNINVLIPEGGLQLSSSQLTSAGSRQTQAGAYLNLVGGPLSPGESLSFHVSGAQVAQPAASLWVRAGAGAAALAACIGAFVWLRSRTGEPVEDSPADEEALLDALAALDDAYEAGQVDENEYRRERSELKAALVELTHGR